LLFSIKYFAAIIVPVLISIAPAVAAYPERPVRIIVPGGAGSGPDTTARLMAAELGRQMGQQFVVDNRPGASGALGTEMIARASADGHIIGFGNTNTLANLPNLIAKLPYDAERDIQPVVQTTATPFILAVTLSLPVKSVQELIAYARQQPGKLLYASGGNAGPAHLTTALFQHMTGTRMTHVAYKSSQQGVTDVPGGQVHLMFDNIQSIGPHVRVGRVRGLALSSDQRSASYPALPTVAESGVPNFDVTGAGGMLAAAALAKAAPDGYTLLFDGGNFAIGAVLQANLPYDPVKDFAGSCSYPGWSGRQASSPGETVRRAQSHCAAGFVVEVSRLIDEHRFASACMISRRHGGQRARLAAQWDCALRAGCGERCGLDSTTAVACARH
jgi:tripartite-type tricarboxylate transporter receptor subunit TctC